MNRRTLWYPALKPWSDTRSCQIALALRPRLRPSWMTSWKGSQALCGDAFAPSGSLHSTPNPAKHLYGRFARSVITALSDGDAFTPSGSLHSTPNPVITSMAGFESSRWLFPLLGRFSGLRLRFRAASSVTDPVITPLAGFAGSVITCMAGFAGPCRDHPPGRHTVMPAAFK